MDEVFEKLSWDDLRVIQAIGERGGLVDAALALGVNHSTMSRRLSTVEQALGVALFDRRRSGYVPTDAGNQMMALGARVEKDILGVARRVSGQRQDLHGVLRIATSDALLVDFLTPVIASFQARHPAVSIDVAVGNTPLNLARGDSDIAFRATRAVPENLYGRRLATIAWAIYGRRRDYAGRAVRLEQVYRQNWVSYGQGLSGLKACGFVSQRVEPANIRYRSDSVYGAAAAIRAGLGVGFLPCMHGDLAPELARISQVEPDISDELWLLTHPDIRRSARVRAFMSHCGDAVARQRHFIEGGAPGHAHCR
ncbi:LysR family transcriptional regulator [Bordetella petrii]|uniref:LysR family transcriptional regulator n=1 Tax=Bordetella petrii TaxID=94624 RepID=UPI001E3875A6|nr:LysR family transcriptional regulator [Bordetella petrii]MCD0503224.1 LysR family transcriptional regulator [Bordetella petrii]